MTDIFVKPFRDLFAKKNYTWFDNMQSYNLNIFSIRNSKGQIDRFDDSLYCIYRDENLNWIIKQFEVTTDPGLGPMLRPVNLKGTAILAPDQYVSVYKVDYHKGKYLALCQRAGTVRVYRDNNKDRVHDFDPVTLDEGYFGINIHKAGEESTIVDGWSAGCTVFKRRRDFDSFMVIVNKSKRKYGNRFTYTLFESQDLQ